MATLLINIGQTAYKASGQAAPSFAQQKIIGPLAGGLHLCDAVVEDTAAVRAAIDTYNIPHGQNYQRDMVCNSPEHLDVYNRYTPPPPPTLPVYSSTSDMLAHIRAMQPSTSDLSADLTPEMGPRSNIRASLIGWSRESTSNLLAEVFGYVSGQNNFYANISGCVITHTFSLEYEETLISTPVGISVLRRLLTTLPDITASIRGWESSDLAVSIDPVSRSWGDISASISTIAAVHVVLNASITPTFTSDVGAFVGPVPPVSLTGSLVSIPPVDLYSSIDGYNPKDLSAFIGGHYPEDITASLLVNQPVALKAWIRVGILNEEKDISASITATGGYLGIDVSIFARRQDRVSDLTASITLVNNLPDLYASITAYSGYNPLKVYIVGSGSDRPDLTAHIQGVVHTGIGADITCIT
ncbi:MAG: hypothetical protein KAS32_31095 [Candidatus Peribacteraceae bacterium]|nr:hypothetical protein [Candidatus Peribacteraceae bacterium]